MPALRILRFLFLEQIWTSVKAGWYLNQNSKLFYISSHCWNISLHKQLTRGNSHGEREDEQMGKYVK